MIFLGPTIYRTNHIQVSNVNGYNYDYPFALAVIVIGTYRDKALIKGIKFTNSSTTEAFLGVAIIGDAQISDCEFDNITISEGPVLSFNYNRQIKLDNITISNSSWQDKAQTALLELTSFAFTPTYINDFKVVNCVLENKSIISNIVDLNQLVITNWVVSNVTHTLNNQLISTGVVQTLVLQNMTVSQLNNADAVNADNFVLSIRSLDLNSTLDTIIQNVTITDSDVSFVDISSMVNSPPSTKTITLQDITISDGLYPLKRDVINIGRITGDLDVQIKFINLNMHNIKSTSGANIMEMQHILPNAISVTDSKFYDLSNIQMSLFGTSSQQFQSIGTFVEMENCTFNNIFNELSPFIMLSTEAVLTVHTSMFSMFGSLGWGSVIESRSQASASFTDSQFINNTATEGGVFLIETGGSITCNNCKIINNFAVIGGVGIVKNNGYFVFINTTLSENFAFSYPIIEFTDNSIQSECRNCIIHDNEVIKYQDLQAEFQQECSLLCFVSSELKSYILTEMVQVLAGLNDETLFKLILSSLVLSDSTRIYNQNMLLSIFLGSVGIQDSFIYNIGMTTNSI